MTSIQEIKGRACILTGGLLDTHHAKTAHGLLRETARFDIMGVIDQKLAGHKAGEFVDGESSQTDIYASIAELVAAHGCKPEYAIIGTATKGGVLSDSLYPVVKEALSHGLHLVNGLHQPLSEVKELQVFASEHGATIFDIRKPKPFGELTFWNGQIDEVSSLRIGVLGTDCSIGKRTTTKLLTNELNASGIKSEMIYTGQTGWMQGSNHGLFFDATPNDFIPGEIEKAMVDCWRDGQPEVILVEGQASLLNPGGPCGSEFIISGKLHGVILQHHPVRKKYSNLERLPDTIQNPQVDIEIIRLLGSEVWAITLNTAGMSAEEVKQAAAEIAADTGIPVICPLEEGLESVVDLIKSHIHKQYASK